MIDPTSRAPANELTGEDAAMENEFLSRATARQAYHLGMGTVAALSEGMNPTRELFDMLLAAETVSDAADVAGDWVHDHKRRPRRRR